MDDSGLMIGKVCRSYDFLLVKTKFIKDGFLKLKGNHTIRHFILYRKNKMRQMIQSYESVMLLLVRVLSGYMFLLHGTAKFFEFPQSMTDGNGAVPLFSQYGLAGALEIVGGILLILGLFTRGTAFVLSGMMAFAYFVVHGGNPLLPMLNGGELAAMYSLAFLMLVFYGGGKYSLDTKVVGSKCL